MGDNFRKYSSQLDKLSASEIREILKLTTKSDIISFAGGLPLPDLFPSKEIKNIVNRYLENEASNILQYGPSNGDARLIGEVPKITLGADCNSTNSKYDAENTMIGGGSQQALDLMCKLFLEPGDGVLVGLPSYLGAIQAFTLYGANLLGVPIDKNGICVDHIESLIANNKSNVKLLYCVPDFQNPTGVTLTQERRRELTRLARKHNFIIIEDCPYRNLRFTGDEPDLIYDIDQFDNTVSLHSYSKILVPSLRLGWIFGPNDIIKKLELVKQPTDLCSSSLSQAIAYDYTKSGKLMKHIAELTNCYKSKRDVMISALETHMPHEVVGWNIPDGGMFLWLELNKVSTDGMIRESIEQGVAYVTGSAFYIDEQGHNKIRLNFSHPNEIQINQGIKILSQIIKKRRT